MQLPCHCHSNTTIQPHHNQPEIINRTQQQQNKIGSPLHRYGSDKFQSQNLRSPKLERSPFISSTIGCGTFSAHTEIATIATTNRKATPKTTIALFQDFENSRIPRRTEKTKSLATALKTNQLKFQESTPLTSVPNNMPDIRKRPPECPESGYRIFEFYCSPRDPF